MQRYIEVLYEREGIYMYVYVSVSIYTYEFHLCKFGVR